MNMPAQIREAALDVINTGEDLTARLRALTAAYGHMIATAGRFDGSYEEARDRFNTLMGKARG